MDRNFKSVFKLESEASLAEGGSAEEAFIAQTHLLLWDPSAALFTLSLFSCASRLFTNITGNTIPTCHKQVSPENAITQFGHQYSTGHHDYS